LAISPPSIKVQWCVREYALFRGETKTAPKNVYLCFLMASNRVRASSTFKPGFRLSAACASARARRGPDSRRGPGRPPCNRRASAAQAADLDPFHGSKPGAYDCFQEGLMEIRQSNHSAEFVQILGIIQVGRAKAFEAVNVALIETYWAVGEQLSLRVAGAGLGKGGCKGACSLAGQ